METVWYFLSEVGQSYKGMLEKIQFVFIET